MLFRRRQVTPHELVQACKMLECGAAVLAAIRVEPEDLEALRWAFTRFHRSSGLIEKTRYDITSHLSIVRAARNPKIETMFGSITSLTVEPMLRSLGDPHVYRIAAPYHQTIYNAIARRGPVQARDCMASHLSAAETAYGEDLDRSLDHLARWELGRVRAPHSKVC